MVAAITELTMSIHRLTTRRTTTMADSLTTAVASVW